MNAEQFYAVPERCFEHKKVDCPPDHPREAAAVWSRPSGLVICESTEKAERLAKALNDMARKRSAA